MLKRLVILLVLLLTIHLALAKTTDITMQEGQSIELEGSNITLMSIDTKNDKALVCVNSKKAIVSDARLANNVLIKIKSLKKDKIRFDITPNCKDCICDTEECSNVACFNECNTDKNCNDYNPRTKDICSGTPKTCSHQVEELKESSLIKRTPTETKQETIQVDVKPAEEQAKQYKTFVTKLYERFLSLFS